MPKQANTRIRPQPAPRHKQDAHRSLNPQQVNLNGLCSWMRCVFVRKPTGTNPRSPRGVKLILNPDTEPGSDSLEGSFSAGSTATIATKYSFFQVFETVFRDLQNYLAKLSKFLQNFAKNQRFPKNQHTFFCKNPEISQNY